MKKKVHHPKHKTPTAPARVYNVGPYNSYWGPAYSPGIGASGGGHPSSNESSEGAEGAGEGSGGTGSGGTGGV